MLGTLYIAGWKFKIPIETIPHKLDNLVPKSGGLLKSQYRPF